MKSMASKSFFIIVCVLLLFGCGKKQPVTEDTVNQLDTDTENAEALDNAENPIVSYFRENGNTEGDSYIIKTSLMDELAAEWSMSDSQPNVVNCHASQQELADCYFRYYINDRIISYNFDLYGSLGSKEVTYTTCGIVDEKAYHEGDELTISKLMMDGEECDPSNFGGTEIFDSSVRTLIPIVCKQLKEFGLQNVNSTEGNAPRDETQLAKLLPDDDEYIKIVCGDESTEKSLIPEEYEEDAHSLDIYKAVNKGETEYILTLLGEADSIANVGNNSFSEYVKKLLDNMSFYKATQLQQNFLEMYAILGNNKDKLADKEDIVSVYASGYSQDGSGNHDNIINSSYVIARCIVIQTEYHWYLFTNQLVGSINPYASESVVSIEDPQVENGQFELEIFEDKIFKFTKIDDSFFSLNNSMKAYQVGKLLLEFNNEHIKVWNEYYEKMEASKYEPGIGMTEDEVLKSSWGKPQEINSYDSKYGNHHEQWVYGNQRYLYFDDGVVTAIQDHEKEIY